ncbi:GNAT family N-acetyltransferase [Microvirga terrestris]|uniref:GNAT family N-acetyltransferase n=1 Tax=Microvirga terrestris TaxID=2791024 RepID=A0ABS0HVF9_9HYPH|nr:GNAT family N-acetyltransferase [Microvirga terrestris]MBF9197503.1 GNAT family N-acetyltransferase [Microvirga terrestris]
MTERLVIRMRRSLADPVPEPAWPVGIRPISFEPDRHAQKVHALLVQAYSRGGGYVEPFAIWWPSLRDDADYDPTLVFVAADEQDEIVGVVQCWTGAFVKDLAVAPVMRRQGLGSALLHQVFHTFRKRGAAFIDLKVHADNPSGALRLYRSHGFEEVESYKLA